jgi:2-iminobutanoate/2-iminopropanoate deaminase
MLERTRVNTDKAPAAFGPFSQAIKIDTLIFTSGQLPIEPTAGDIVKGGIKEETRQVLLNLKEILIAAGSSLENVVKATVYITNMEDFPEVNEVYAEFFPGQPPARACVEVSGLAKGANVEIDAVALVK